MIPEFLLYSGDIRADRRYEYARAMADSGDVKDAIEVLEQTLELAPHWPVLPFTLGECHEMLGQWQQAEDWYKKTLEADPEDHLGATTKIALLGRTPSGDLPAAFIKSLFDQYAPRFDKHLLQDLYYKVPQLMGDMVKRHAPDLTCSRILDLGCGTGLATEIFAAHANWAEGVDLSPGMLAQARQKGIYNALHEAELGSFLKSAAGEFDLILAADVLIYMGALDSLFKDIARRLDPKGAFLFSLQKLSENMPCEGYKLSRKNRFSHQHSYVCRALSDAGLHIIAMEERTLRNDGGRAVDGLLYLCTPEPPVLPDMEVIIQSTGQGRRRKRL